METLCVRSNNRNCPTAHWTSTGLPPRRRTSSVLFLFFSSYFLVDGRVRRTKLAFSWFLSHVNQIALFIHLLACDLCRILEMETINHIDAFMANTVLKVVNPMQVN